MPDSTVTAGLEPVDHGHEHPRRWRRGRHRDRRPVRRGARGLGVVRGHGQAERRRGATSRSRTRSPRCRRRSPTRTPPRRSKQPLTSSPPRTRTSRSIRDPTPADARRARRGVGRRSDRARGCTRAGRHSLGVALRRHQEGARGARVDRPHLGAHQGGQVRSGVRKRPRTATSTTSSSSRSRCGSRTTR